MEYIFNILLAFIMLLGSIIFWRYINKTEKNIPGPMGLPLIGNVHQIGKRPYLQFMKWAKTFGPIFTVRLLNSEIIVISDYKIVQELFNSNAASGRLLCNPLVYEFTRGNYGVINAEGSNWEHQRRFTLRMLRDLGFGKTSMESLITYEARVLLKWLNRHHEKPIYGTRLFNAPVVNSLWQIVSGERCEWEENRSEILDTAECFFESINTAIANGIMFAPWLRKIAPEKLGWNKYIKSVDEMMKLFKKAIQNHEETFDPSNIRDLVDFHLQEIHKTTNGNRDDGCISQNA